MKSEGEENRTANFMSRQEKTDTLLLQCKSVLYVDDMIVLYKIIQIICLYIKKHSAHISYGEGDLPVAYDGTSVE